MKSTLLILWVALQVAIARASIQTLVLAPACSLHETTTAAATHAAVGQPGSLDTLFICPKHNSFPRQRKGAALAQCRLPSVLARYVQQQSKVLEEWVLLIGPNFTFNQSIAPSDFLGLGSLPKIAAFSTNGIHLPLNPQRAHSNDLTKDLFGTRQPPGPKLLEESQQSVTWDALLHSSPSAFLLIRSQDLIHLAPRWQQLCESGAATGARHGMGGSKRIIDRAYKVAAQELSIMHIDASQAINKAPPAYKLVHPPAIWPQGAPEPVEVLPLAPYSYSNAPLALEQVHTKFGIRVVYRGSKDKAEPEISKSLSNMNILWATRHSVRIEARDGWIYVVEERSLFLPPAWIVLALWLAVVVALLAYELS